MLLRAVCGGGGGRQGRQVLGRQGPLLSVKPGDGEVCKGAQILLQNAACL